MSAVNRIDSDIHIIVTASFYSEWICRRVVVPHILHAASGEERLVTAKLVGNESERHVDAR